MAISAIKDDTYYTEQGKTAVQAARDAALKDNTTLYTGQTDITNKTYDAQVDAAGKAYDQSYRENAVQKAINERQVAESMANLGLTNSGLNRTQQTAIQLSYANNKAGIDRQRQSALSELDIKRAQDLATIEQNKLSSEAEINQYYDGLAQQYAADLKTADVSAYESYVSNVNKQAEESGYIIKTNGATLDRGMQGTLAENDISVVTVPKGDSFEYRYVDNKSNKSTTFQRGVNPFTGDYNADKVNIDTDTKKGYNKYGAFENGYQPKGVCYNGEYYGYVSHYVKDGGYVRDMINGNLQYIHKTIKDGKEKLWIWDRAQNSYIPYEE